MPKAPEKRELPPFLRTDIAAKVRKKKPSSQPTSNGEDSQEEEQSSKSVEPVKAGKKRLKSSKKREVEFPVPVCELFVGEEAMTAEQAKKLLGWQEESTNIKFDKSNPHHFKNTRDLKIRCNNNVINRPLYMGVVNKLKQEHLRGRWKFNGEPIIIGKTGLMLNGQHSCISLIFATEEWQDYHNTKDLGKKPPTMEKLVVYGVDEGDDTANTMDTCKPRSFMDVVYRSEFYANLAGKDRRNLSKITDKAVGLLWERTGVILEKMYRTHAESLDFIDRHPKILDCAKHIYEENGNEAKISQYIGPGAAAGLLYLMGCSSTVREQDDKTGYSDVPVPTESLLDWEMWDQATEFWVCLAGGDKKLIPIRQAIAEVSEQRGFITQSAKLAIVINAWQLWKNDDKFDAKDLVPEFIEDDDGNWVLSEHPDVGGIDLGKA